MPQIGDINPFKTSKGTINFVWDGVKWVDPGTITKKQDGPMDLGTLLGGLQTAADIYSQVRNTRNASFTPPIMGNQSFAGFFEDDPNSGPIDAIDNALLASRGGTQGMVFDPAANCGAGKWIKKRRKRRRKALVTPSEISQLAQLKGTLGQGKTMETWIATHS